MYIIFTDKSEVRWSPMTLVKINSEFLEDTKAFQFLSLFLQLKNGEIYNFKKYLATLEVDVSDPLFVRMFAEDRFPGVEFIGYDGPEIPYKLTPPGFIG
jgi:hypothetical protein